MPVTRVSEKLSVSSQPSAEDIRSLHENGFATLINNRPDGEESGQPGTEAEAQ